MRIGLVGDHGGFELKEDLKARLIAAGHEVTDFGPVRMDPADDYPDFAIPLAEAIAARKVERGIAVCGSGVGVTICMNKVPGVRACLVSDHYSAHQGVEHDHMNVLCLGGRVMGAMAAWDYVEAFLGAAYSQEERHVRRLKKVAALEAKYSRPVR